MKKMKLMISAVCVFALVGTTLAFESKKFGNGDLDCRTSGAGVCPGNFNHTEDTSTGIFLNCDPDENGQCNTQVEVRFIGEG